MRQCWRRCGEKKVRSHVNVWSVHSPSIMLQSAPITLLTASLSHLLSSSNLRISRALNTPSAFLMKHSALLCFAFQAKSRTLYLGFILFIGSVEICFANTFSRNGTNYYVGFLPCSLPNGVLTPGQDASCTFHQPRQNKRFIADWFLCASLNVTLDGLDISTFQHHRVLDEPIRLCVSLHRVDLCFVNFSHTISERNDCRLCVAFQRHFTVTKQVNELRHSFDCPRFFDALCQRNTARRQGLTQRPSNEGVRQCCRKGCNDKTE